MAKRSIEQVVRFQTSLGKPAVEPKAIRKRKYSRGGCDECKRRKMKCDETKPFCNNCTRLKKTCVYQVKHKFRFENIEHSKSLLPPKVPAPYVNEHNKNSNMEIFNVSQPPIMEAPQKQTVLAPPDSLSDLSSPLYSQDFNVDMDLDDMRVLLDEASLLVSDINDLAVLDLSTGHPNSSIFDGPRDAREASWETRSSDSSESHNFQLDEFTKIFVPSATIQPPTYDYEMSITNTELINRIIQHHKLTSPHVTYLKILTTTDLSYHLFPFASSIESNEVVKLLLKYLHTCSYLLTSLLAISATFQYNQTGKRIHELSRQKYTAVCLRLLSQAFANTGVEKLNKDVVANDIERLLLTVLVLTSNFTSTGGADTENIISSWKIHLRGARDVLINYGQLAHYSSYVPGGLALSKTWFFSIEALASLYSTQGGTIIDPKTYKDDDDMDTDSEEDDSNVNKVFIGTGSFGRNSPYHDALVRIGLLVVTNNTQFNLYAGFTDRVVNLINEVTKGLIYLRAHPDLQISPKRVAKMIALLHECYNTDIVPKYCRQTYIIPTDSPGHPDYPNYKDKITLPPSAYGKVIKDDKVQYISWFDLSEQARTHGIYLKILTTKGIFSLPKRNPLVRQLVKKICNSIIFLKYKNSPQYERDKANGNVLTETTHYYLTADEFDNRTIMIQSPFKQCSKLLDNETDFEKIELYFLGVVKLGNGSALSALDLLYKYRGQWRKVQAAPPLKLHDDDVEETYQEDELADQVEAQNIPFA